MMISVLSPRSPDSEKRSAMIPARGNSLVPAVNFFLQQFTKCVYSSLKKSYDSSVQVYRTTTVQDLYVNKNIPKNYCDKFSLGGVALFARLKDLLCSRELLGIEV